MKETATRTNEIEYVTRMSTLGVEEEIGETRTK